MTLTITDAFVTIALLSSLVGCGAFSDETKLEIQMYGVARAPASAAGDRDPQFQSYTVESIVLNSAEGNVALLNSAETFKIVDRPQILLTHVADDLVGRTFTGLTITFANSVTGGDNESPDLNFTLSNPTITLTQSLLLEKENNMNFAVKAIWANTIRSDTMSEPAFEIVAQ